MAATNQKPIVYGFLPNDRPANGKMILLGFQHVLTMFPATVLAAILMKFDVSTVLAVTGFGTVVSLICSRLFTGTYIPLYYGASFSYIAAVTAYTVKMAGDAAVAPAEVLQVVQTGFIMTAILNILVGFSIRVAGGKQAIDKILPPIVTGSVACVIGIGLGAAALNMASGWVVPDIQAAGGSLRWWFVAVVTLVSTVCFSVYLQNKGFIGLLPVLLGAIVGYVVALIVDAATGLLAQPGGLVQLAQFGTSGVITIPRIHFPNFSHPDALQIMVSVGIMCIATIPESTAHLYQISLYVDHLAEEQRKPKLGLSRYIGINLIVDGINDLVNGLFGSTAGTNYGENNSLMVITRNYSGPVLMAAGGIAILLGFVGPLKDFIYSIPTAVTGGLSIYLFGVIGMQGIALMISEKVNLFDPRQLAIGAVILIIGIGGNIGYPGGFLPIPLLQSIFPNGWPAIATAAVAGVLLNLIFLIFVPEYERGPVENK